MRFAMFFSHRPAVRQPPPTGPEQARQVPAGAVLVLVQGEQSTSRAASFIMVTRSVFRRAFLSLILNVWAMFCRVLAGP